MRQTCVLMVAAVPAYGPLACLAGGRTLSGAHEDAAEGPRALTVTAALVGAAPAAPAVPVRRGGNALWRTAPRAGRALVARVPGGTGGRRRAVGPLPRYSSSSSPSAAACSRARWSLSSSPWRPR